MPPDGYIDLVSISNYSFHEIIQSRFHIALPTPTQQVSVRSHGHLRISAHIRRQLAWSVRDSWVNWDRLESVGLSCQSFSDLKFSEIVEGSCTFSCQFHRGIQVVIELHWVEFCSADRPDRGRLIQIDPPSPQTGIDRQPTSYGYLQLFEPTESYCGPLSSVWYNCPRLILTKTRRVYSSRVELK